MRYFLLFFEQIHPITIYCAILRLRFQGKIFSKKRHLLVSSDDIFTTKPDWPQQQETRKFFRLFTHFSKSRENIFWKVSLELKFMDFFSFLDVEYWYDPEVSANIDIDSRRSNIIDCKLFAEGFSFSVEQMQLWRYLKLDRAPFQPCYLLSD